MHIVPAFGPMMAVPASFNPLGVNFDGNDSIQCSLSGLADSKLLTFSMWFKRVNSGAFYFCSMTQHGARFIFSGAGDVLEFKCFNAAGTNILQLKNSGTNTTSWHHVAISVDMADTAKRHLYYDGSADMSVVTWTNDTIDFTDNYYTVGSTSANASRYSGDFAEFFFAPGQYIDLSVAGNLAKFISAGRPVDLGSNGSTPLGVQPNTYLSVRQGGSASDFMTNRGSGGSYSIMGGAGLTLSATNP